MTIDVIEKHGANGDNAVMVMTVLPPPSLACNAQFTPRVLDISSRCKLTSQGLKCAAAFSQSFLMQSDVIADKQKFLQMLETMQSVKLDCNCLQRALFPALDTTRDELHVFQCSFSYFI